MKKNSNLLILLILPFVCLFVFLGQARAACRNPNLVVGDTPFIVPVAASGFIEITWFGHAFFEITSSSGTKIITDPFSEYIGYPVPEVWPHVVTVGRESRNHNNVELANGEPVILRGLDDWGLEWNEINTKFRDVLIYNVPIHTRAWHDLRKGSAFVFEMDGMCICHTGDIGEPFNEDQLDLIGHVDILLIPIGDRSTIGPEEAKKVVEQLKPKIVVPMHYYNSNFLLESFLDNPHPFRYLEINKFSVSKDTLPPHTEIYVPHVIWYGRDDDL
jgi:L-ascorbate metabolism protein UlaG (beta-lactamase superfamily)